MVKAFQEMPAFEGSWLLGALPHLKSMDKRDAYEEIAQGRPMVRFRLLHMPQVVTTDVEVAKAAFGPLHDKFKKTPLVYNAIRPLVGDGLLRAEGPLWQRQRRIMNPAFRRDRLAGFAQTMVDMTEDMLDGWVPRLEAGETLSISTEMAQLTLRIVGQIMLSTDVEKSAPDMGTALCAILEAASDMTLQPIPGTQHLPSAKNRAFKRHLKVIVDVVQDIIAARVQTGDAGDDLLGMLLLARDDDGTGIDAAQLLDEVLTIFMAGHETTANALSWAIALLLENPAHGEALRAALDAHPVARDLSQPLTQAVLAEVPEVAYAVNEALRVRPPVWAVPRTTTADIEIGGYHIPKGVNLTFFIEQMQKNPAHFDEPHAYKPTRWKDKNPYNTDGFIPFITGRRMCIGRHFADMEAQLLLGTIWRRVLLYKAYEGTQPASVAITMRPKDGVRVTGTAKPRPT